MSLKKGQRKEDQRTQPSSRNRNAANRSLESRKPTPPFQVRPRHYETCKQATVSTMPCREVAILNS